MTLRWIRAAHVVAVMPMAVMWSAHAAAPVIQSVTTLYSTAGAPALITITASGLPATTAAAPTVTLGTLPLVISARTATTLTAVLPAALAIGDYPLSVVNAPGGVTNTANYALTIVAKPQPGPQGPIGPQGPAGLQGVAGPQGPAGVGMQLNTTLGSMAADSNSLHASSGSNNSAFGYLSLYANTSGLDNSAFGLRALYANTTGNDNSAFGNRALDLNNGTWNNAFGSYALAKNTTGNGNSAFGYMALGVNTTGYSNNAFGYLTLASNTTGLFNQAVGSYTLQKNTTGNYNDAVGYYALSSNTTGGGSTAMGSYALRNNTTGNGNVALGTAALLNNVTGSWNIALGNSSGTLLAGSNNIAIAHPGTATDSGVIRIGQTGTQTRTFIAGISGVTTGLTASAVVVDANGQLGTVSSSRRYKEDIHPMSDASDRLLQLRPVTFRYRQPDAQGRQPLQYGLIAEEVAEVMPELVVYNQEGKPETVAYHLLASLLLNELQKERQLVQTQGQQLQELRVQVAEVAELRQQLAELKQLAAQMLAQQRNGGAASIAASGQADLR